MLFASMKLRMHPKLKSPTVLVVVDRKDLDTQITGTFTASDVPNMVKSKSISDLEIIAKYYYSQVILQCFGISKRN